MEGLNMDKFLLQGRRVLITGATGLIGYHLAKKLLESDVHVVAMGRNEQKLKQVFQRKSQTKIWNLLRLIFRTHYQIRLGMLIIFFMRLVRFQELKLGRNRLIQ